MYASLGIYKYDTTKRPKQRYLFRLLAQTALWYRTEAPWPQASSLKPLNINSLSNPRTNERFAWPLLVVLLLHTECLPSFCNRYWPEKQWESLLFFFCSLATSRYYIPSTALNTRTHLSWPADYHVCLLFFFFLHQFSLRPKLQTNQSKYIFIYIQ